MDINKVKNEIILYEDIKNIIESETNTNDDDKLLYEEICKSLELLRKDLFMLLCKDLIDIKVEKEVAEPSCLNTNNTTQNIDEIKNKSLFEMTLEETTTIGLREKYLKIVETLLKILYKIDKSANSNNDLNKIKSDNLTIKDLIIIIKKYQSIDFMPTKKSL